MSKSDKPFFSLNLLRFLRVPFDKRLCCFFFSVEAFSIDHWSIAYGIHFDHISNQSIRFQLIGSKFFVFFFFFSANNILCECCSGPVISPSLRWKRSRLCFSVDLWLLFQYISNFPFYPCIIIFDSDRLKL